ncbi:serine/threonine-protein kinase [Kitasatospora sp. NPDC028055]|uniref:serine/threonine-protein kinase n=1 Tax=Kitasatospora sp. NPDC028055 TaxID=3155653 RepID=UPI0033D2F6D9
MRALSTDEPREIAGYRLLAQIGEGGMGSVYLSRTRGNQPLAIKVIRREYAGDPEFRRRFQQEVRAAEKVRGYHLVPVLDHDAHGEQPWLATAYVPGLPLDEALDAHGPLPLPVALQLVGCVARALDSMHSAGIVHRDLKPGNLLLGPDGPWVIDFGIARAAEATRLTQSGGFIGTPQFMSPEHGIGSELTPATDVFALGLIAAVAATGRHPYGTGGALTVATRIANTAQRPADLSGYPDGLRPLLERCLAADPAARPTPAELAELCEQASGRPSRDLGDWLPASLAAAVAERRRQVEQLLTGADAQAPGAAEAPPRPTATYVPTQASGNARAPYGDQVHSAPTQTAGAPGPAGAGEAAGSAAGSAAQAAAASRRRRALVAGALAVVLAAAAGTAWALSGDGKSGSGTAAAAQPEVSVSPRASGQPGATGPADAASGSGAGPGAGPGSGAASPKGGYTAVFTDRPLMIGTPAVGELISVDLDAPKVNPRGEVGDHEAELTYIIQYLTFGTPVAKSAGTSPEACRQAVDSAPLPSELSNTALIERHAIAKGDVLCTVTSKGNLAMLRITDVRPAGTPMDPPAFAGLVTLWKPPS